jgi:hypothetical protein
MFRWLSVFAVVATLLWGVPFTATYTGLVATYAASEGAAAYGSTAYSNTALSNTPAVVKATPGLLTSFNCYNSNATVEYLQFADILVQAVAVTGTTNGTTSTSSNVLHFAATPSGVAAGQDIVDTSTGSAIAAGTTVVSFTATTVTMSANAAGGGVGGTDGITFFTPPKMTVALTPSTVSNSAWPVGVGFPFNAISVAATSGVTTYSGAPSSALACTFTYN